jgi:hypothetical protein
LRISENKITKCTSVEAPIGIEYFHTENLYELFEGGFSGFYNLSCYQVSINDVGTVIC